MLTFMKVQMRTMKNIGLSFLKAVNVYRMFNRKCNEDIIKY